jgi:hypothetical protein
MGVTIPKIVDGQSLKLYNSGNSASGSITMNGNRLQLAGSGTGDVLISSGSNLIFQGSTATLGGVNGILSMGRSGDTIAMNVSGVTYSYSDITATGAISAIGNISTQATLSSATITTTGGITSGGVIQVGMTTSPYLKIGTGSSTNCGIYFSSVSTEGRLWWNDTNDRFEFRDSNSAWANIQANTYTSNVATGTAPLSVFSTTTVSNLSSTYLDGRLKTAFAYSEATGSTDLNTITQSGMYRMGSTDANLPTGANYGQLIVVHGSGDTITQIASDYASSYLYWRSGNPTNVGGVGSWGAWRKLWHDGNITFSTTAVSTAVLRDASGNFSAGTITATLSGNVTNTGALSLSAGGTNQNITLTPTGTGCVNTPNSIGIGTSAPSAKLHIYDSAVTAYNDTYARLIVEGTEAGIQVQATDDGTRGAALTLTNGTKSWSIHHSGPSTSNALKIGYKVSAGSEDIPSNMTSFIDVTTDGKIGIGIAPYAGQLTVNKANSAGVGGDIWIHNSGTKAVGSATRLAFSSDASTDTIPTAGIENIMTDTTGNLSDLVFKLYNGSYTEKMRILSSGRVTVNSADNSYGTVSIKQLGSTLGDGLCITGTEGSTFRFYGDASQIKHINSGGNDVINLNNSSEVGVGTAPVSGHRLTVDGHINIVSGIINHNTTDSYDKIRVYDSSSYTIGMKSGNTFGYLADWAMTFTMNNESDRGFLWRDYNDAISDGAMSLTTDGRLYVKDIVNADNVIARTNIGVGGVTVPTESIDTSGTVKADTGFKTGGIYMVWDDTTKCLNWNLI